MWISRDNRNDRRTSDGSWGTAKKEGKQEAEELMCKIQQGMKMNQSSTGFTGRWAD